MNYFIIKITICQACGFQFSGVRRSSVVLTGESWGAGWQWKENLP
jgi:hypothetical protein